MELILAAARILRKKRGRKEWIFQSWVNTNGVKKVMKISTWEEAADFFLLAINVLALVFMAVARVSPWSNIDAMMYHIPITLHLDQN
jgi:hypothetical protein